MNPNHSFVGKVMTVSGAIAPQEMRLTLPHEHVMSTFGEPPARYPYYDIPALRRMVLPYLEKVKQLGCQTLIDCTAAYFGRHPELLRQLSAESGVQIITNTGYYAAAQDRYVPDHARRETAAEIAAHWSREFFDGIDETGIRPGFIKTAVDDDGLSELDEKLVHAAILTHRQTGLTIQTHTGANLAAAEGILQLLEQEGVSPSAWVWVHAHQVAEGERLAAAARRGAWISLDGVSAETEARILGHLMLLRQHGLLGKALISHDGDSYCGGNFRPYDHILAAFLPRLRQTGFTEAEIRQLVIENPAQAFTLQVRLV